MSIDIANETDYGTEQGVDPEELVGVARYVLGEMGIHPMAELSILLVDTAAMEQLHIQWMDEPGPTDVLSFPMDELRPPADDEEPPEGLLGDIVLCPAVTARQAAEHGRTPEAEAEYLLVHGLLHLLGYDHGTAQEQADMFGLKDDLLAAWVQERAQRGARGTRVR
jgi:probable rRNA maturation factor